MGTSCVQEPTVSSVWTVIRGADSTRLNIFFSSSSVGAVFSVPLSSSSENSRQITYFNNSRKAIQYVLQVQGQWQRRGKGSFSFLQTSVNMHYATSLKPLG